jgi:hypothetical protein
MTPAIDAVIPISVFRNTGYHMAKPNSPDIWNMAVKLTRPSMMRLDFRNMEGSRSFPPGCLSLLTSGQTNMRTTARSMPAIPVAKKGMRQFPVRSRSHPARAGPVNQPKDVPDDMKVT